MADWKIVRFDPSYEEPMDAEIIPLCDALNAAGFVTTQSCCGHGRDWPRVWFEHSEDKRIEEMARFVMLKERGDFRPHFTLFQKEIELKGYRWMLEIHLNEVYRSTPEYIFMEKANTAIGEVTKTVNDYLLSQGILANKEGKQ